MSTKRKNSGPAEDSNPKRGKKAAGDKSQDLEYLSGFGNEFESEAIPGALPKGQNNPQRCPLGLYAEQVSGTAFTAPRDKNERSWLYKIMPSAKHSPMRRLTGEEANPFFVSNFTDSKTSLNPNQLRWKPMPFPKASLDFVRGIRTMMGAGSPECKNGVGIHMYAINKSMGNQVLCNSDGDFLIVPQEGTLRIRTEFGIMLVPPGYCCVIQRLLKFSVDVEEEGKGHRGYMCEVFNGHFKLPDLGPIGANGLANARDFETPVASYEDKKGPYKLIQKFCGELWGTTLTHSPFDVVAWHGNYAPYRYNLDTFCPVNSVRFDHMDPSIFTVLTVQSNDAGTAICDFVIFPPRWATQENSFRPPYYHRNCMSEFMGNLRGSYDAKPGNSFSPGAASLHSVGVGHGPDRPTYEKLSTVDLGPVRMSDDDLAFMFESCLIFRLTDYAQQKDKQDIEYYKCWQSLARDFEAK